MNVSGKVNKSRTFISLGTHKTFGALRMTRIRHFLHETFLV